MNFELTQPKSELAKKLIDNYYANIIEESDGIINNKILPIGSSFLTFFNSPCTISAGDNVHTIDGIVIAGQYDKAYNFIANPGNEYFGITLHPTTLYKLFGIFSYFNFKLIIRYRLNR